MGSIGRVVIVGFLAAGCGGMSSQSQGDGKSDAGAPHSGMTASAGTAVGGTDVGASGNGGVAGNSSGGATTGGSATAGAAPVPRPVDLGDGDHADDGRPTIPAGISTGGFFWGGCDDFGWRLGNWFVTSDRQRDAFSREIDPPREASTQAHGVTGADFPAGVALWVQLDHPSGQPVKLSGCSAVSFWARFESPSGQVVVALNDGSRGSGLLDGQAVLPSRTLGVGPDWKELVLPFESFPGLAADDLSLASVEFFVGEGGEKFDLWIDDLAFVCSDGCP
jgi:hypothetical protein